MEIRGFVILIVAFRGIVVVIEFSDATTARVINIFGKLLEHTVN